MLRTTSRTAAISSAGARSDATTCVSAQLRLSANWRCARYTIMVGAP